MLKAKDIMETNVITVTPDTDITKAGRILLDHHINGVPVVDSDGRLKGILCQSDLIFQHKDIPLPPIVVLLDGIIPLSSSRRFKEEFEKAGATQVAQAMVKEPVSVEPDVPISEIANLMVEYHYHTIPVVENGRLVGIIGKEDILKILVPD